MEKEYNLSNEELRIEVLKLVELEGINFVDIKGKDYSVVDIENALIKGIGVNCIK